MGECKDCLSCTASMSEPAERDGECDRLFCVVKQKYVNDDECCESYN